ncbi:MAG: ABC transporter substrate-binding protein [Actinomycetota bacterium]|nr:ABC transporter substrate-binding protein [Actinomycetota bacterium]
MKTMSTKKGRTAVMAGGLGAAVVLSLVGTAANAAPTPAPTKQSNAACPAADGVTPASITIGDFIPKTGPAAATFIDADKAVALRLAQENAKGGVYGRKINVIVYDDQANGQTQTTMATKALQSDHVFGVIMTTATDSAMPTFKANNVPVTGFNALAMATDRNAFSATGVPSTQYVNTATMEKLKSLGVTSAAIVSHNSPSAANSAKLQNIAAGAAGVKQGLLILDETQGTHDATSTALRIKNSGADGAYLTMFTDGVVSIVQALKQQGVNLKGINGAGIADPAVIAKSGGALEGVNAQLAVVPIGVPGHPAVRTYANGMKAAGANPYASIAPVGFAGADLMIKGLKLAGPCPTREKFISALRNVSKYDAGGLLPAPISFKPGLLPNGTPTKCAWFVTVQNGQPVPDKAATCGKIVEIATGQVVG